MAFIAQEISLQDYQYAQSANIKFYEFPEIDAINLLEDNNTILRSLENLSHEKSILSSEDTLH